MQHLCCDWVVPQQQGMQGATPHEHLRRHRLKLIALGIQYLEPLQFVYTLWDGLYSIELRS